MPSLGDGLRAMKEAQEKAAREAHALLEELGGNMPEGRVRLLPLIPLLLAADAADMARMGVNPHRHIMRMIAVYAELASGEIERNAA